MTTTLSQLPFRQGDWITGTEKFTSLGNVQLFDNPLRLEQDPYLVGDEYRIKVKIKLNQIVVKEREFTVDHFKKTQNPAHAQAESRLRKELSEAPKPVAAPTEDYALIEQKVEDLKKLIKDFIQDDEVKKEMAEKVDTVLRLVQLREKALADLEDRMDALESDVKEILRQKKLVAFSGAVAEKTQ